MKIIPYSIFFLCIIICGPLFGADCEINGFKFEKNLEKFVKTFPKDSGWMGYPIPNNLDVSSAIKICLNEQSEVLIKEPYITGCGFESKLDPLAKRLYMYMRNNTLYRLSFILGYSKKTHAKLFPELKKKYGTPTRIGKYNIENSQQNVITWNRKTCRIVYEYGHNKKDAHSLYIETSPAYTKGFNPQLINEKAVQWIQ